ncbi:MAG: LTA synthase family protein [Muribaculaceae bacterium]|nr:LTA synthase family protein [Muribaculaceae bacterium]
MRETSWGKRWTETKEWLKGRIAGDSFAFYTIYFVALLLVFGYIKVVLLGHLSIVYTIKSATADASLIMLASLLPRGNWKYLLLPVPLVVAILMVANALFFRTFGDIIPATMYFASAPFDPTVMKGGGNALRWFDFIPLIISLAPTIWVIIIKGKRFRELNAGWGTLITTAVLLIVSWTAVLRSAYIEEKKYYPEENAAGVYKTIIDADTWKFTYDRLSFWGYALKCINNFRSIYITLTPEQEERIRRHLADRYSGEGKVPPGSVPENLIIIVVESLPWSVYEMETADDIMPNLRKLAGDSTAVTLPLRNLSGLGNSSDSQFMINTGLLPLKQEALVNFYGLNDYPSIGEAFAGESMEIIGEDSHLWNHTFTNKSYGFDKFRDKAAPGGKDQDRRIFALALAEVKKLKEPFFLFVSTLSMHYHYKEHTVTSELTPEVAGTQDKYEREYLNRVNHFDKSLGEFIAGLKRSGLYDRTLIIITGDHPIPANNVTSRLDDDRVFFTILNSPKREIKGSGHTQLDIFPTVLDLMGIDYNYFGTPYKGLGVDIFESEGTAPSEEDYAISELIIKS